MSKSAREAGSDPRALQISGTGSFVAVPDAFPEADARLRHAVKLEFRTLFSERHRVQTTFSTDMALIDLRAVEPTAIDPERVARDCELVKLAMQSNPAGIIAMIESLLEGSARSVEEAGALADSIGLTERATSMAGGGLIHLVVVAAAALLAGGCATLNSNKPFKQQTTPSPTSTPDAGVPSDSQASEY